MTAGWSSHIYIHATSSLFPFHTRVGLADFCALSGAEPLLGWRGELHESQDDYPSSAAVWSSSAVAHKLLINPHESHPARDRA